MKTQINELQQQNNQQINTNENRIEKGKIYTSNINGDNYVYEILDIDTNNGKAFVDVKEAPQPFMTGKKSVGLNSPLINSIATNEEIRQNQELDNSSFKMKEQQLEVIQKSNPMLDDYHTGIRSIEDIKTPQEVFTTENFEEISYPDFTYEDSQKAIEKGKIVVYSSYPIEQGVFITPSKFMAQDYAGNGKIYSKEISINDVAWIDNIEGQYAKVTSLPKTVKGNIPINEELYNKYNSTTDLINSNINNYDGKVEIKENLPELENIDFNNMSNSEIYHLAKDIFQKYNNSKEFINDGNIIKVDNGDIKESIGKILRDNKQKLLLKEHIQIFSDLGDIIESAEIKSQALETKKDKQQSHSNNNYWSYYLNGLNINNNTYIFEFDVVSRNNGENHYRVQRLQEIKKTDVPTGNIANNSNITPDWETSVLDNNIPLSKENVKLPSVNNMQQNRENNPILPNLFKKSNNSNYEVLDTNNIENLGYSEELIKEIENKTKKTNKNNDNVIYVSPDKIIQYISNGGSRIIGTTNKLVEQIRNNGITEPIQLTLNSNGNIEIYNGNHRLYIAKSMGLNEIPITFVDVNKNEIKKILIENNMSNLYNNEKGDNNEQIRTNRYDSKKTKGEQRSEDVSVQRTQNKGTTNENEIFSKTQLPMDRRSYSQTATMGNIGISETNGERKTTGINEQNRENITDIDEENEEMEEDKIAKLLNIRPEGVKPTAKEIKNKVIRDLVNQNNQMKTQINELQQQNKLIMPKKITKLWYL